ncbi:DUF4333 domain-containing protein, partial [Xanthomonas citri pv. citri]|nr:DUF4333 domain-containing protein [Xanthomonas citri pv. citri]
VVVLVAAGLAVWWFLLRTTTLDPAAAQDGVAKILTENYGAKDSDIADVSCPSDQEVKKDESFDCTLKLKDVEKTVTITFT